MTNSPNRDWKRDILISAGAARGFFASIQSTRLSAPDVIRAEKCRASFSASALDRIRTPTSMFLSCAASVKFADEMKAVARSTTTHFACNDDRVSPIASSDPYGLLSKETDLSEAGLLEDWVCNLGCPNCGGRNLLASDDQDNVIKNELDRLSAEVSAKV